MGAHLGALVWITPEKEGWRPVLTHVKPWVGVTTEPQIDLSELDAHRTCTSLLVLRGEMTVGEEEP